MSHRTLKSTCNIETFRCQKFSKSVHLLHQTRAQLRIRANPPQSMHNLAEPLVATPAMDSNSKSMNIEPELETSGAPGTVWEFEEHHDLAYVPTKPHKKQHLDMFVPTHLKEDQATTPSSTTTTTSTSSSSKKPVIVFVHGGGWQRGDRKYFHRLYTNVGQGFAAQVSTLPAALSSKPPISHLSLLHHQGFVTAVVSYRLARPQLTHSIICWLLLVTPFTLVASIVANMAWVATAIVWTLLMCCCCGIRHFVYQRDPVRFPTHAEDCAKAVAWVQRNAHTYGTLLQGHDGGTRHSSASLTFYNHDHTHAGGDSSRMALVGHSAGGHIVSLLALDESYLQQAGVNADSIKGIVSISGVYSHDMGGRVKQGKWHCMHTLRPY